MHHSAVCLSICLPDDHYNNNNNNGHFYVAWSLARSRAQCAVQKTAEKCINTYLLCVYTLKQAFTLLSCVVCLFVSVAYLKPWGSSNVGWEGSVYNHFPTPVHTATHTSTEFTHHSGSCINFSSRLCYVMKITVVKNNPDTELLTHILF